MQLCVPKYNISSAVIMGKMTEINNDAWNFFMSEKKSMKFYIKNPTKKKNAVKVYNMILKMKLCIPIGRGGHSFIL